MDLASRLLLSPVHWKKKKRGKKKEKKVSARAEMTFMQKTLMEHEISNFPGCIKKLKKRTLFHFIRTNFCSKLSGEYD